MKELPRKWLIVNKRGRVTIPKYLLDALNLDYNGADNAPIMIQAHPDLKNTKSLILKKG